jgi:two-component system, chemotaxis family, sensor kinase CheA
MAMIDDQETLQIFLEDAREHLSGIEKDFLAIEAAGSAVDVVLVNKVFRAVHSIKGGAGFLGLDAIKELAHAMENLLNLMRNGALVPTPAMINTLLAAADVLTGLVHDPASSEAVDTTPHIAALEAVLASPPIEASATPVETRLDVTLPDGRVIFTVAPAAVEQARKGGKEVYLVILDLLAGERQGKTPQEVLKEFQDLGTIIESTVEAAAVGERMGDATTPSLPFYVLFATLLDADMICGLFELDARCVQRLTTTAPHSAAAPQSPPTPPPVPDIAPMPPASPTSAKPLPGAVAENTLRVHVKLLDSLMTLAGELVLTRNQLLRAVASGDTPAIEATTQRVDLVTSELQEAIMSTRLQPLGNVFHKFQRLVRDLAKELGKEVTLVIEGEEVELDKAVLEAIGDPLTHLVRNGIDHGIERPQVRQQAGKAPQATLKLSAWHEAGQVIIEVTDDGAGIDPGVIKDKALRMGLREHAQLDAMSDKELVNLIFLPGFSTAQQVTDISGRGVGMDVVHTNLTKLGGTIEIESQVGRGTTFSIKLPLTLAIMPCLLVAVAAECYAVPQVNLVELIRVPAAHVADRLEYIGAALVMRRRGSLLPIVSLRDLLGHSAATPEQGCAGAVHILVVAAGDLHYGLIVDALLDSEEIVVKPLGQHLQDCKSYAGATILGDGRVALILDVMGIRTMMHLAEIKATPGVERQHAAQDDPTRQDFQSLLLVRNAPHEQFAVPLSLVSRIERISAHTIESSGGRRYMQYRGGTLRLLALEEVAHVTPREATETPAVIVFTTGGREVGLMVACILDVLEAEVTFDSMTFRQPGILGSAVLMGCTTLLVDLFGLVAAALPDWVVKPAPVMTQLGTQPIVLIVEDSHFFLHHIKNFVEEAGYQVCTAMDGLEALQVLEKYGDKINLVLTDIEMPNLDGLGLTARIRNDPRFASLPVLAVTSVCGEGAEKHGLAAGVDAYLIKLDQEKLLVSIAHYMTCGRAA